MSEATLQVPAGLPPVSDFLPEKDKDAPAAVGWSIVIRMLEPKTETSGGIILSDTSVDAQDYLQYCGQVVSKGSGAYRHPKFGGSVWCLEGDWVVFGQHAGIPCVYDGVRYRIIDDDQIKAVVKSPEALRVYVE